MSNENENLVEIIGNGPVHKLLLGEIKCLDGDSDLEAALRQQGSFIKVVYEEGAVEYLNAAFIFSIRPYDPAAREAERREAIEKMKANLVGYIEEPPKAAELSYKVVNTDPWVYECLKCSTRYTPNATHKCAPRARSIPKRKSPF